MASPIETSPKRKGAACPICGKPVVAAHRPFCSPRCRDVDLNRWLGEAYRVPAETVAEDDEDPDSLAPRAEALSRPGTDRD